MLVAIDGDKKANGEPDSFRIRIWDEDEITGAEDIIYDNGLDEDIYNDEVVTADLGGGSIIIHDGKGKN